MSNYATSLKRDLIRRYHHLGFLVCLVVSACLAASQPKPVDFRDFKRILFLGDSITYSGQYVAYVEAAYRKLSPNLETEFLNLGLPSETVSGLSEPGHANGRFPRPDLHERLDRVLEQTQPDLVVACYGMNCGIYHPFSEARFEAYKKGIMKLKTKTEEANAQLILLTPPTFDSSPIRKRTLPAGLSSYPQPYAGYDEVLDLYSHWLLAQQGNGWRVIDVHGAMKNRLRQQRKNNPDFLYARDGVHMNDAGHWLAAQETLKALAYPTSERLPNRPDELFFSREKGQPILNQIRQRQRLLSDAWLSHTKHVRPGMKQGLPLQEAKQQARSVDLDLGITLAKAPFPGHEGDWHGFRSYTFEVAGNTGLVVLPKHPRPGRPWVWHGEFFGHKPAPDIALLKDGFYAVYLRIPDHLGSPKAVSAWNEFYKVLTQTYGLAEKPGLVGLSRGGLYVYNWAIQNPDHVACIYGDAPVCDFKSWPGGLGKGQGSERDWNLVIERYGFTSHEEAISYPGNPIDRLAPLAAAHVPLLHVFGDADNVVPWEENTGLLAGRYLELQGPIQLIRKAGVGHHPHGLDNPAPIVHFLKRHVLEANNL